MLRRDENRKRFGIVVAILGSLFLVRMARADAAWQEQAKLLAQDGAAYDYLGDSVSTDGDYVILGAPYDDDRGDDSGSAYIFKRDEREWIPQAKLITSDGLANDRFGYSVCISGNYAIVGAPYDDDGGTDSGSAYIFRRSGTSWTQQAKLTAPDGATEDLFGTAVSISGDYAIVGVHYDDDRGDASGSAYIFRRSGTSWLPQAKLTASDGSAYDEFGCSVSISGDYAIVGAIRGDSRGLECGCAYIFIRSGTTWTQQAKLVAPDAEADDKFGFSVSINGDFAIVGVIFDDPKRTDSGSAYIFRRNGTSWLQQAKLVASDSNAFDEFGKSVSISPDYAVVGAHYNDDRGGQSGSAYIFKCDGTDWFQQAKLTASDGDNYDQFGASVSISGDYVAVGASYNDDRGTNSGSAYIFRKACPLADLNGDCGTDFIDFALLATHWLGTGCELAYWCSGTDLDHSSYIDWTDFAAFAQQWRRTGCAGPGWCNGADINHSSQVDWTDLSVIAGRWLEGGCDRRWCDGADFNHSGKVDWDDVCVFAEQWLQFGK